MNNFSHFLTWSSSLTHNKPTHTTRKQFTHNTKNGWIRMESSAILESDTHLTLEKRPKALLESVPVNPSKKTKLSLLFHTICSSPWTKSWVLKFSLILCTKIPMYLGYLIMQSWKCSFFTFVFSFLKARNHFTFLTLKYARIRISKSGLIGKWWRWKIHS